jgi:hypothetical protein
MGLSGPVRFVCFTNVSDNPQGRPQNPSFESGVDHRQTFADSGNRGCLPSPFQSSHSVRNPVRSWQFQQPRRATGVPS